MNGEERDIVINAKLASKYVSGKVLDVQDTLQVEYDTDYGQVTLTHTLEYIVKRYGPPTSITRLISSFPTATAADRQAAVIACLPGMSDKNRGVLIVHALHDQFLDIARVLFDNGGQFYFQTCPNSVVLMYGMQLPGMGSLSVLNPAVAGSTAARQLLLEHILKNHTKFPMGVLMKIITNLGLFVCHNPGADLIPDFAAFIRRLYKVDPRQVITCRPVNNALRGVLLTQYGILYDSDLHSDFYAQFKANRRQVAKLQKISDILDKKAEVPVSE